ncbi:MAG: hypothetical protein LBF60_09430 [Treponema sp.]|nr:hypothetical protein [Treponema sp.]
MKQKGVGATGAMNHWEGIDRFELTRQLIAGRWIHGAARLPGDQGSWTRERAMPLAGILRGALHMNLPPQGAGITPHCE